MAAAGGMGDGKGNLLAVVSYIVNELLMTGTSWIQTWLHKHHRCL